AAHALEQRGLPRAVVAQQAHGLAVLHVEVDVLEGPEVLVAALRAAQVDEALLQGALAVLVDAEALGDAPHLDGGRAHSSSAKLDSSRPNTRTARTNRAQAKAPTMARFRRYQSELPSGSTHTRVPAGSR